MGRIYTIIKQPFDLKIYDKICLQLDAQVHIQKFQYQKFALCLAYVY